MSRSIIIGMFLGGFLAPFTLIITFYILLLVQLRQKNQTLKYRFENMHIHKRVEYFHVRPNESRLGDKFASSGVLRVSKMSTYGSVGSKLSNTALCSSQTKNNFLIKRERQVTRTIALCVSFFCITWFPYVIVVLIAQFGSQPEQYITPVSSTLPALFSKLSVIFNPLIYTLTNSECKSYLRKKLCPKRTRKRNKPHLVSAALTEL